MQPTSPHASASPASNTPTAAANDHEMTEKSPSEQTNLQPELSDESRRLVDDTNVLLARLGFGDRAFANVSDLVASVSSMSVAIYEKLFQFRLRDVERVPTTRGHYAHNAQLVASALQSALLEQSVDDDLVDEHTGERLIAGDLGSIRRLLTMLEHVYMLLFGETQEVGDRLRDESFASLGMMENEMIAKKRVPPKVARKQRKERGPPKSDDPMRSSLREKRVSTTTTRRITASRKQEEVRGGRAVTADSRHKRVSTRSGADESRLEKATKRAEVIAENNKKRSRMLEQSFRASHSSRAEIAAKEASKRRAEGSGVLTKSTKSQARKPAEDDKNLLETKPYKRFIAAGGDDSDDDAPEVPASNDDLPVEDADDKRGVFFEGVSSVQHDSNESMHFIEEESALAHNFSFDGADRDTTKKEMTRNSEKVDEMVEATGPSSPPQKSTNQQEAEEEDEPTTSPVRKKVARNEPHAPNRVPTSRKTKKDPSKSLYPLLPKTKRSAATSKAQAQQLRYKLSLKNHLQDLRQREASQRKHLERAYKSGEHLANVDKIRSRRFEQDVRLRRIAVGMEAKIEEEKQLRHAMHHLLDLEKEKLREETRLTTSVLKQIQREHSEREQAMENFYANQIKLVQEQTQREAKERELVEKAQREASEKMMRELRKDRESQLAALLQEKQHLAETRRFRHASKMAQQLEKTDEVSTRKTDAFYTAAMKARERRTSKSPLRSSSVRTYRSEVKRTQRSPKVH